MSERESWKRAHDKCFTAIERGSGKAMNSEAFRTEYGHVGTVEQPVDQLAQLS